MRKILLALTFAVAGLGLFGKAEAKPIKTTTVSNSGNGRGNSTNVRNTTVNNTVNKNTNSFNTTMKNGRSYHQSHGFKFSGGFYFKGKHHNHWGHRKWDSYRRCYVYWEPTLLVYYYYNESQDAYYPCD
jgi:hypothetical protein